MSEQGQGSEGAAGRWELPEPRPCLLNPSPVCCPHSSCSRCLRTAEIPVLFLHFALLLENTALGRVGGTSPSQNAHSCCRLSLSSAGSGWILSSLRDAAVPSLHPCSPGMLWGLLEGTDHPRGWCPGDAGGSEGPAWLCCSSCPAWGAGKQLIPPGECGRHRGRISCARNVPGVMCRAGGCTGGSSGVWGQWGPGGSSLGESQGLCPAGSTGATPGR